MESPEQYYNALPPAKISDPHTDSTPSLGKIRRSIPEQYAMMIVSIALMEVRDWFNTSGNLTDSQIAMLAEMILDRFYDYSLNEIKAVFRRKMCEGKVYRIDGNIIMGWLSEYDLERDNAATDRAISANSTHTRDNAVSFSSYLASLEKRAGDGDKEAADLIEAIYRRMSGKTLSELKLQDEEFRKFNLSYKADKIIKSKQ